MRKRIGVWLTHMGPSQLALDFINSTNKLIKDNVPADVIGFVQNIIKSPIHPLMAVLPGSEIFEFPGVGVACDLELANRLLSMPGPRPKYFYDHSLAWTHIPNKLADTLISIYQDDRLNLLCRSQYHKDIIRQTWGRDAIVIDQSNLAQELYRVVSMEASR